MEEAGRDRAGAAGVRALTGCALCALIVSTLLGNTLVCVAVIRFRHLRSKVTNFFVISLAVSDLFVAVLVMPWKAVSEVAGFWLFGSFCDTWIAFDIMCSTASILNLCIISLDRYWAISSPFRYERKMTQRVACVMIGITWTLSVLISFIPVRLNWHKADGAEMDDNAPFNRSVPLKKCTATLNRTYAISSSLISFYIPVIIMIGTYTRIYRIAQTQIRRISTLERHTENHHECCEQSLKSTFKKETKVLQTLSVIMGVFVFCWLPFFVLNCVVPFCDPDTRGDSRCVSGATFNIFVWFGWANSSVNPVIYAFNADFRKAFAALLGCNRLCASSAVEAVNFSDELVSYRHDTTLQKDAQGAFNGQETDLPLDKVSVASDSPRIQNKLLLSVIEQQDGEMEMEMEMEISVHMMPFCSTGLSDCCGLPGTVEKSLQVQDGNQWTTFLHVPALSTAASKTL